MTQPSKEQWRDIEKTLDSLFNDVHLLCDGFYVSCGMKRTGTNDLKIVVYVNGYIKGSWALADDDVADEAARFWRPITKARNTTKRIKEYEKVFGKRWCKKHDIYKKYTTYQPYWLKPKSLINHLKKNNKDIQIITRDQHNTAVTKINMGVESE